MGETGPLVSIVVPVYNGEKYVRTCLHMLQQQTLRDWEVIFVNDGSADNSGAVLEELAATDVRVHVYHQQNGGTARARNCGLEHVNGKFVTFMDCDDELEPEMYETLVRLIEDTGADMSVCGYYFKVEQDVGGEIKTAYLEEKTYPDCVLKSREQIREKLIDLWDKDMLHNVWNKVYRMGLIREKGLRYRDGHVYSEDRVFNRLFLENCESLAVTGKCLYYYVREHAGSTSEKYWENYFDIRRKEYIEQREHFEHMQLWNEASREYVCREFVERIAGCIENVFHAEDSLSPKEKREKIRSFITHPDVQEALQYARCRSRKMRLLLWPVRRRDTLGTYWLYKSVYLIRKRDPSLFHRLKSER